MQAYSIDYHIRQYVTAEQFEIAVAHATKTQENLYDTLVSLNFLTEKQLAKLIEDVTGFPFINLMECDIPTSLWCDFNIEDCLNVGYMPFFRHDDILHIAVYDVMDLPKIDYLKRRFANYNVNFFFTSQRSFLDKFHHLEGQKSEHHHTEALTFLDELFTDAVRMDASDIHFQPYGYVVHIRLRIDGVMHHKKTIDHELWQLVGMRLKVLSDVDISEHRKPLSGSFQQKIMARPVDFRVSFHPTVHGHSAVLRVLDKTQQVLELESLGFSEQIIKQLLSVIKKPFGLFLIGGPTGSGKTTTLYSLFSKMDIKTLNIMTLEDPVEYDLPGIRQTEMRDGVIDFETGVRSILRQDPDVIFIGEIRDKSTAQMALRASMTGHLVFATVHANDCKTIPQRLIDLGVNDTILKSQLVGLMTQRLIRKICQNCEGSGCKNCFDGYRGRTVIAEVITDYEKSIYTHSQLAEHVQQKLANKIVDAKEVERVLGQ